MKICFVPIDNRPVCYSLAENICAINSSIELFIPPQAYLGDLKKISEIDKIFDWLEKCPECDCMILSLDTLVYGGLVSSRRGKESLEEIKRRLDRLKPLLKNKKVYAFSSIMRISNNNCSEEEKEYWADFGKQIFKYSYNLHKYGSTETSVPNWILEDYINTRTRNFEVNKIYLEWQKEGIFNTLIFSKDDCAEFGLNVMEAEELEKLGGKTKTGADEIPLSLLARAIEKKIKVFTEFTEPDWKEAASNYEDISVEKSVSDQLELAGFEQAETMDEADIILLVNNFIEKQGELVMGWETKPYKGKLREFDRPYAIADVRYANGADNEFVNQVLETMDLKNFYGYAGWNTSANTVGSLLAAVKVKFNAMQYNDEAFKKLQIIRFLDDWGYQANVRGIINEPCDISKLMKPYEKRLFSIFGSRIFNRNPVYCMPWKRKFEVEINL